MTNDEGMTKLECRRSAAAGQMGGRGWTEGKPWSAGVYGFVVPQPP
ncbi:MAG TPA: hypothetical protein VG056_10015 [Pirellulales bacterium]|nr:hypothetical protein [Pirellulales bacterium]